MPLEDTARFMESLARECPTRAPECGLITAVVARRQCDILPFLGHSGRLSKLVKEISLPKRVGSKHYFEGCKNPQRKQLWKHFMNARIHY